MSERKLPRPVLNDKELKELERLKNRYNRLQKPNAVIEVGKKAGKKVKRQIPNFMKDAMAGAKAYLNDNEFMIQALKYAGEGFKTLEEYAARATVNEKVVIKKINKYMGNEPIERLDEVCFARAYDVSHIVGNYKRSHVLTATLEGAVTGAFGFAGIVPNLVLSLFIYFRAVQSVAMYYGYDVKNNPDELEIASSVLMAALSPETDLANNELTAAIGKFMVFSETTAIRQAANKTWAEMIQHGGVGLLIAQIRALAHKAAENALKKAGEKGLEQSVFKGILEQLGKIFGLKTVGKSMIGIGALFGALFDTTQMKRIVNYADIFYSKRFIEEKQLRINSILHPEEFEDDIPEDVIDADYEVSEDKD